MTTLALIIAALLVCYLLRPMGGCRPQPRPLVLPPTKSEMQEFVFAKWDEVARKSPLKPQQRPHPRTK